MGGNLKGRHPQQPHGRPRAIPAPPPALSSPVGRRRAFGRLALSEARISSTGARLASRLRQCQLAGTRHTFPDGARVKAPNFNYVRATSLAQVLQLLERYGDDAQILAGGQSLMPALHMRPSQPKPLTDIHRPDPPQPIAIATPQARTR